MLNDMRFVGIIPARYASSRFPGKPLAPIDGKSMIERVYTQAAQSSVLDELFVATDDQRIFDHVTGFDGKVVMTSAEHATGTSRCTEALEMITLGGKSFDVVINIQGDEPFINPVQIDRVAECFADPGVQIATLVKAVTNKEDLLNPNIIKVVTGTSDLALYFSRAAIPYVRDKAQEDWLAAHAYYKHIGIYSYRSEILKKIAVLPPGPLEQAESLEQLRWLENGYQIHFRVTEWESHSVDCPEDLEKF